MHKTIGSIFAIAAIAITIGCSTGGSPERAATRFYSSLQHGEFDRALTYTNISNELRDPVASILKGMDTILRDFKVLSSETNPGDTTASVQMRLTTVNFPGNDTVSDTIVVPCIVQNGRWKVQLL